MTGLCRHFGDCGGCRSQDVPYPEQLERKAEALAVLFPGRPGPIPTAPSPSPWHYRNKVELAFHRNYERDPATGKLAPAAEALGFKRRGRWYETLDVSECRIFSPELGGLLAAVRGWASAGGLSAHDPKRRSGALRHLLLREGKRTGERMAVLLAREPLRDPGSFAEAVRAAWPGATVLWGLNQGAADVAWSASLELLAGEGRIAEELWVEGRRLRFSISPFSFFQTNTLGAELLYGKARRWAEGRRAGLLLDLYGGSGGFAFALADLAERVLSVESVASAGEDGRRNAAANGVSNVEFVQAEVEAWLKDAPAADAAVVDPPRCGLHPKALKALVRRPFPRLLYVSCNPKALSRELPLLEEAYRLTGLEAVDLFPHTEHVEVLASFEAR